MNETLKTVLRYVFTIVGGWLIGKNVSLFGNPLDTSTIEIIGGALLSLISVVWSFIAKELTEESLSGALRHIVSSIGTIFVSAGRWSPEQLAMWLGLVTALAPIVHSWLTRRKNVKLKTGEIQIQQLKTPDAPKRSTASR
jgi:hypothetical protein